MSAKSLVTKLRMLAQDPVNRPYIVKDQGCLPGLVIFLEDQDQDVVFLALEVIYFLSLEINNREMLAKEPGLLKSVRKLMATGRLKQKKVGIAAYTNLQSYAAKIDDSSVNTPSQYQSDSSNKQERSTDQVLINKSSKQQQTQQQSQSQPQSQPQPLPQQQSQQQSQSQSQSQQRRPAFSALFGDNIRNTIGSALTYTIFITGLKDDGNKKILSDCLLNVKGVISFTIDLSEQKVVVRTSLSVDTIIQQIFSSTGMRGTTTKEIQPPYIKEQNHNINNEEDKENSCPDYLPEVEQKNSNRGWFGFGAIVSFSDAKKNEKQRQEGSGFFGRLGKALNIL